MNQLILVVYVLMLIFLLVLYRIKSDFSYERRLCNDITVENSIDRNNITPAFFFIAAFSVYSSIGLLDRVNSRHTLGSLIVFSFTCLVGLIGFIIGYGYDDSISISKKKYLKMRDEPFFSGKINALGFIVLITFVIAAFVYREKLFDRIVNFGSGANYLSYYIRGDRTTTSGIESAFASYFILLIMLYPFYNLITNKRIRVFDIVVFLIVFLYSFLSGDRTNVVLAAMMVAVVANYRLKHIKFSTIIYLGIIGGIVLVLIGHLRKYNSLSDMIQMLISGDIKYFINFSNSGEFRNTTGTLFDYIESRFGRNFNYNFGYTYVRDFLVWIPTVIYPSRPLPWAEQYMLDFYPNAPTGTGHAWFILTDGYMSFGPVGAFGEMIIFGYIVKRIYLKYFELSSNPINLYLYAYYLLYIINAVRSCMLLSIKNYIIAIGPVLIVLFFANIMFEKKEAYGTE